MRTLESGTNNVVSGESGFKLRPKNYLAPNTRRGLLYAHGAGSDYREGLTYGAIKNILFDTAIDRLVVGSDFAGNGWGNNASMSRMTTAYDHAVAQGAKSDKVAVMGLSMGGQNSLVWAAENPSKVSCIVLAIPVIDVTDIHTNNRGGSAASINSAYAGGWSQGVYGTAKNPLTLAQAGAFAQIPILLMYGTGDTLCLPSKAEEFAGIVGSNVQLSPFAGAHDFTVATDGMISSAIKFIKDNI